MIRSRTVAGILSFVVLTGCATGGGDGGSSEPQPAAATFERIQKQVFDVSCTSDSCHSSVGRAADLVLDDAHAWNALVNQPPSNPVSKDDGQMRVMPGQPEQSLLMHKISGELADGEGQQMPYGGAPLNAGTVDVIEAWILAGAPRQGLVPGDDGRDLGPTSPGDDEVLPPPDDGIQVKVTSPPVPEGKEETGCHYLKLPSDVDLDINRFKIAVSGGSHHIHLYRAVDRKLDLPDHYETCNAAVNFDTWELVIAVQLRHTDWQLPPGVAFHFRAGEQILVQTHFVNVGSLDTTGEGKAYMNLHTADPGTITAHAGALFGQDRDVFVPARSETTLSAECVFPKSIVLMAQTGHYHFRGRRFRTYRWDDGERGDLIYEHEGYDDPLFQVYDPSDPLVFAAGQGLQWECLWMNDTGSDYEFGAFTDTNEHCNLFGFYYPTDAPQESMTCVKENGVATTAVR